jgi:triosephosphate isomerase
MPRAVVGVSLKMYFGHHQAVDWCARVAEAARSHPALTSGDVALFVIPSYLVILPALDAFAGTPVLVGAQDVAAYEPGAYTGEVSAAELAEAGVRVAEVGHAERRRLFGETDEVVAAKTAAALRHGIAPVLCVGETERLSGTDAAAATIAQLPHQFLDILQFRIRRPVTVSAAPARTGCEPDGKGLGAEGDGGADDREGRLHPRRIPGQGPALRHGRCRRP